MNRRILPTLSCSLALLLGAGALHAEPKLVAPQIVTNVTPPYPASKAGSGEKVSVQLLLTVDASGKVTEVSVTKSGGEAFDEAAKEAAKGLVFTPATKDGAPIPAKIPFTFSFAEADKPKDPAPAPAPIKQGALRGRVANKADEALAGASVRLLLGDKEVATAVTGVDGAFAFAKLEPGTYSVEVSLDGFSAFKVDETIAAGEETQVVYRPSPVPVKANPDGPIEIEVKGEKPPREVTRHVIDAAELKKVPGTNGDPVRVVENMPGVARPPGAQGLLIVRGSSPYDTGIFVDGTQIPIAYHFGGLVSVIPGDVLDRIEFYPGNYGVQFGRGMGGIVDLGLRSPRKDGFHALGQVDLLDGRALIEGPLGKDTRFLVAARRSWVDAWLKPVLESTGTGVSTAPFYYDGQVVLEHDFSDRTTGRVAFFGAKDRLEFTLNAPDPADPVAGNLGVSLWFWYLQGRVQTKLPGGHRWTTTVSYGADAQDVQFASNYLKITTYPLTLRTDFRAKLSEIASAVVGVDTQWINADIQLRVPPIPREGEAPSPFFARPPSTFDFNAKVFRPGAYAMLDLRPSETFTLLPGVRVDYTKDTKEWNVSPRIAGRWDVTRHPRTTLKGGVGMFYQPPQPNESVPPYGVAGLGNNRSTHYSLGIERELAPHLDVSIEGFYKDLRNLVVQRDAASSTASGATWANTGSGRVYGAEFLLRYRNDGKFFGWIAYTLSKSQRRDAPGESLRDFQYDQTHILSVLGSYQLGNGWQIGGRFRYVTGNPYTPYTGGVADYDAGAYSAIPGPLYSARDGAFHQLDLRVDKTWKFSSWKFSTYLDVQNTYNHRNPEGQQYNYNYSKSQAVAGLPILPIIGVRGEL